MLEDSYKRLDKLSIDQDELIRQALRCIESGLFRAAHVMAWAGFMDFFEEKLASDGLAKVAVARPKWRCGSLEDLRESTPEHALIEVAKDIGLCRKNEMKALHGLPNKRNECAHPSSFFPDLNESLGFVAEILRRIDNFQARAL